MTQRSVIDAFAKLRPLLDESLRNWAVDGVVEKDASSSDAIVVRANNGTQLAIRRAPEDDRPARWNVSVREKGGRCSEFMSTSILGLMMEVRMMLDAMPAQVRPLRIGSASARQ